MRSFKCVLLGAGGVGKSSILLKAIRNQFNEHIDTTIGASYNRITTGHGSIKYFLDIWDTAGQERFDSLIPMYYRDAHVVIIVYDVSNRKSFDRAQIIYENVVGSTEKKDRLFLIIGNKCDQVNRQVNTNEVPYNWSNINHKTFECSAKDGSNIDLIFETIEKHIRHNLAPAPINNLINLHDIERTVIKRRYGVGRCCSYQ